MRALVLLLLAVALSGCVPPLFSSLHRPEPLAPPPRYAFVVPVSEGSCPARTDSTASPFRVSCLPGDFNAHVASRRPERIGVATVDRRTLSGPSIWVRGDTARLGSLSVPLERVDHLTLVQPADNGQRLRATGLVVGTMAGFGAGVGALSGNETVATGEATLRGFGAGAVVGLAFAAVARGVESSERFEVVGWSSPETAPQGRSVLAQVGRQPSREIGGQACGHPLPPSAVWIDRCEDAQTLTTRAGAYWVEAVEVHLRDGGHLSGRDLLVTDTDVVLDGVRQPRAAVSRIELSAPYGRFRVVRPAAKGALTGAAYGLLFGAAVAIGSGDADGLWRGAALGGGLGATSGLTLGLARGRDRVRDVTYLPDPGP